MFAKTLSILSKDITFGTQLFKIYYFLPHCKNQHMCIIHVQEENSNSKCKAIIQVCYSLFTIENSFPIYIDWVMQVGLVMSSSFPHV